MAEKSPTTLFEAIGGTQGCRELSRAFYARVDCDPLLRPLFPGKTFKCAIEEFAAFLIQLLGGPAEETKRRWWLSLRESHLRFSIAPAHRDAWMNLMAQALDDIAIDAPVRDALRGFFAQASAYLVNTGPALAAGLGCPHAELARRWQAQLALDEAVAAIRAGDPKRAIALAAAAAPHTGLLAAMIADGQADLLHHVRETLMHDHALPHTRYAGRTLLHAASAAGNLAMVELLLGLGGNPNAADGGGHPPLYTVGNQCQSPDGAGVVRALVRAGADANAHDGVKHCTPLHMAARRGSLAIAAALLDCGAALEARDSQRDTPLRRAVNCGKTDVAALLLARGADPHSRGSRGLTPSLAARTSAMKRLFQPFGA